VKRIAPEVDAIHLGIRNSDPGGIRAVVNPSMDFQAFLGGGAGNKADDNHSYMEMLFINIHLGKKRQWMGYEYFFDGTQWIIGKRIR